MTQFTLGVAIFLIATIVVGTVWIMRGPSLVDRLLAIQLFGTTGVAALVLIAKALSLPALRDVALVLALLAAITAVAFVKCLARRDESTR